eukprot:4931785-Amphidinium_carterae.1
MAQQEKERQQPHSADLGAPYNHSMNFRVAVRLSRGCGLRRGCTDQWQLCVGIQGYTMYVLFVLVTSRGRIPLICLGVLLRLSLALYHCADIDAAAHSNHRYAPPLPYVAVLYPPCPRVSSCKVCTRRLCLDCFRFVPAWGKQRQSASGHRVQVLQMKFKLSQQKAYMLGACRQERSRVWRLARAVTLSTLALP